MRSFLCLILAAVSSTCALGQTTPVPFLDQLKAQLQLSGLRQSLTISGTANWDAGSTHDSGPARLVVRADGSFEAMLALGLAPRADTSGPLNNRSCQWVDGGGAAHPINGASCFTPLPWFCPQIMPLLLGLTGTQATDGGELLEDNVRRYKLIIDTGASSTGAVAQQVATSTQVIVYYDLPSLLPSRLEYSLHPTGADNINIPVRVDFSDYRLVSGIPVPFHLERFINRTRDLTIVADTVVLN